MAFIDTIPARDATGDVYAMYERQQGFWGHVPDFAKVFCHRPEVMERWGKMLAAIKRPVDARRLELVTFVAAHALKHSGCSLAHGAALAGIIGKDAVISIANGDESDVLDAADCAMLRFARQVARDASTISAVEVAELRQTHGFSDAEIFDIAAIAASRCFFTKLLDALGTETDPGFRRLDAELRSALTVGRPIGNSEPEHLAIPSSA